MTTTTTHDNDHDHDHEMPPCEVSNIEQTATGYSYVITQYNADVSSLYQILNANFKDKSKYESLHMLKYDNLYRHEIYDCEERFDSTLEPREDGYLSCACDVVNGCNDPKKEETICLGASIEYDSTNGECICYTIESSGEGSGEGSGEASGEGSGEASGEGSGPIHGYRIDAIDDIDIIRAWKKKNQHGRHRKDTEDAKFEGFFTCNDPCPGGEFY